MGYFELNSVGTASVGAWHDRGVSRLDLVSPNAGEVSASVSKAGELLAILVAQSLWRNDQITLNVNYDASPNNALVDLIKRWIVEDGEAEAPDLKEQFEELRASRLNFDRS